jgi:hypothetical protein
MRRQHAAEAGAVAEPVASRYRTWPYDRLVEELLDKPTIAEVAGKSGASYQVEVEGFWDSGRPGDLRVMVAMDDGGFSAFRPLTVGFIVRPDEHFRRPLIVVSHRPLTPAQRRTERGSRHATEMACRRGTAAIWTSAAPPSTTTESVLDAANACRTSSLGVPTADERPGSDASAVPMLLCLSTGDPAMLADQ